MPAVEQPGRDSGTGPEVNSEPLVDSIRQAITDAGGAIDFSEFMHKALYEPGLGYYVNGQRKFGAQGDFVTAPEMGNLFARCLAKQCAQIFAGLPESRVLEFGAGSGALAADVLLELKRLNALPAEYLILEVSPDLKARQQQRIQARCPPLLERCRWLERLPDGFSGVVLANEVVDAMPVERFRMSDTGLRVIQVGWGGSGFVETERRPGAAEEDWAVDPVPAPGYESEIGLWGRRWMSSMGQWLERGVALVIDYGFPAHEYYHPQRSGGTLMCHHRHKAHTDPYRNVGFQDITAHVDFTALADSADRAGLDVLGYCHQAGFLISLGLLDLLEPHAPQGESHWRLSQEVQRLTDSSEMGELYKVLAVGRGVDSPLLGFEFRDQRGRL